MAANRDLALAGRRRLNDALELEPIAPESMIGAMAAIQLREPLDEVRAESLTRVLATEDRIEVPVGPFPVRAARLAPDAPPTTTLLRISAQRYNEADDYDRLADALVARLGSRVSTAASAIVAG
jgi:isopenicillin-N epimerase